MLRKPASVAADTFKSAKWDELTEGREFNQSQVPTLTLLVQWYAIVEKCLDDMTINGQVQVAYQNDLGDLKAFPHVRMLKEASAEIRALNKQLGINDEATYTVEAVKETPLHVITNNRRARAAAAD